MQKRNYPILNAVSTMSGSPNGHTRLEITGDYLMEGAHGHADMSDLSPELVVCAGRQACDVDYFSSDSKKLVCLTRPTLHPRGIAALSVAICDGSEGTCLVPSLYIPMFILTSRQNGFFLTSNFFLSFNDTFC